jgi:general secretion pathway protein D
MKVSRVAAAFALAALPVAVPAEESSRAAASKGDIEVVELITRFAKRTGRQFVVDPRVRAQIPLAGIDAGELTYEQLLAVLDVHQVAVTRSGGLLAVVPDANARQLPSSVHTDPRFQAEDHEIVTLLVQPKNVCAAFLVPVLRPLMPQAAHLAAEIQSNTLIVTDRAVNARRIAELTDQLDKRGSGKKDCPTPGGSTSMAPGPATKKAD